MKIVLWIVQIVLALAFAGASYVHSFGAAQAQLQPGMQWIALLAVMMLLAIGLHLTRGEYANIAFPLVLGALAAFVAYGRWQIAPSKRRDDV
jgi:hypothetical protein